MASSAVKRKIVVCGGNGFLGSRICKAASARGWQVTSISRSGEPRWDSVTASAEPPAWSKSVAWEKGNVLEPESYRHHLTGADSVVHTMGILLEADYKGVLQGREPIWSGLQRAFSRAKAGSQNPLERKEGEPLRPGEPDGQLTYELMNRDSAIALAKETAAAKVPTFIYISAAAGAPILPARYLTTKREAEAVISRTFPNLRSLFFRAPFLWDPSRQLTVPIALAAGLGSTVNNAVGDRLGWLLGAGGTKPLRANLVADAVVEAVEDDDGAVPAGPVEPRQIEALGMKAWRRNML